VELSEWSFDKCQDVASLKWFKCRIVGVLKGHSNKATKKFFYSAEIKFIGSGREVVDCNLIKYKLIGPPNPVRHRAPRELQSIMAPFSKGDWPVDYSEHLKNIGLFFCPNPAGSTLPKAAGPSLSEMMIMVAQGSSVRRSARKNKGVHGGLSSGTEEVDSESGPRTPAKIPKAKGKQRNGRAPLDAEDARNSFSTQDQTRRSDGKKCTIF
jgi:hypothetical protein